MTAPNIHSGAHFQTNPSESHHPTMSGAISPFPVPVTLPDTTLHPEVPYKLSYLHELKKKAKKRSDELLLAERRLQRQISKHSSHVKDIDWHIKHHARILYWSNPPSEEVFKRFPLEMIVVIIGLEKKLKDKVYNTVWGLFLITPLDREIRAVSTFHSSSAMVRYSEWLCQWLRANEVGNYSTSRPKWKKYFKVNGLDVLANHFKPVFFSCGTVRAKFLGGDNLITFTMKYAEAVFYSVGRTSIDYSPGLDYSQRQCRVLQLHPARPPAKMVLLEDKTGIAVIFRKTSNDIYFYGGRNKIVKM